MPIESANGSEVRRMEITIKATPEELAKMLQAIGSSKEQKTLEKLFLKPLKETMDQ